MAELDALPPAALVEPPCPEVGTEVRTETAPRGRKRALAAVAGLALVAAAGSAVLVTANKKAKQSARPAHAQAMLPAKPRLTAASEAQALPALESAPAAAEEASPALAPGSDGSDAAAPSCDQLLAAEAPNPRDAMFAYHHVREGHRELVRGNWDLAERAFCRAVREPDATASTRFELAQALLIRRDSAAAAAQAEQVLALEPGSQRAQELLGDALVRTGESEKACRLWLDASRLPLARMGQRDLDEADQATAQHDFVRAERYYRRVTGCQPTHALAQAKLAATLAKLGQAGSAQSWARRALQLAPDDLAVRAALPASLR